MTQKTVQTYWIFIILSLCHYIISVVQVLLDYQTIPLVNQQPSTHTHTRMHAHTHTHTHWTHAQTQAHGYAWIKKQQHLFCVQLTYPSANIVVTNHPHFRAHVHNSLNFYAREIQIRNETPDAGAGKHRGRDHTQWCHMIHRVSWVKVS